MRLIFPLAVDDTQGSGDDAVAWGEEPARDGDEEEQGESDAVAEGPAAVLLGVGKGLGDALFATLEGRIAKAESGEEELGEGHPDDGDDDAQGEIEQAENAGDKEGGPESLAEEEPLGSPVVFESDDQVLHSFTLRRRS